MNHNKIQDELYSKSLEYTVCSAMMIGNDFEVKSESP